MISFRRIPFATTIICVLSVNGVSNYCPDGEEDNGSGCEKCKEGFYRNGDMPVCRKFRECVEPDYKVRFKGNETHDVDCYCARVPFTVMINGICYPTCPDGEYLIVASCQPCPPGKWKNFTGPEECKSCIKCNETLHECNSTVDAICSRSAVGGGGSTVAESGNLSTGAIAGLVILFVVIVVVIIVLVVQRQKICPKKDKSDGSQSTGNRGDPGSAILLKSARSAGASNNCDVPHSA